MMLKKIPAVLPPWLLYTMAQMGHGDEIVLGDANFPSTSVAGDRPAIRADGVSMPVILEAVLELLPLDDFVPKPAVVMQRVDEPDEPAPIWKTFQRLLDSAEGRHIEIERLERFAFYERARKCFAVVATGETALYANIILKKGVIRPE